MFKERYKTTKEIIGMVLLLTAVAAGLGPAPSVVEHWDGIQILIGVMFSIIVGYTVYNLRKIDKNQTRLFERLDEVCKQVDTMQGEHNVAMKLHNKRKGD